MGQNAWDGPLRPANNCGMKDAGIAWLGNCFAFPAGVALQTNPWLLACKGLVGRYDWIYLDLEIRILRHRINNHRLLCMYQWLAENHVGQLIILRYF